MPQGNLGIPGRQAHSATAFLVAENPLDHFALVVLNDDLGEGDVIDRCADVEAKQW